MQAEIESLVEAGFGDADAQLEACERLSHVVAQQARRAQSLTVVCGEWPGQEWSKPVALGDVVRAATGRIAAFERVRIASYPEVQVELHVEALIHLVAELLANAVQASPPREPVRVEFDRVGASWVVLIEDRGTGLHEEDLARARALVSGVGIPTLAELGNAPHLGLAVVGAFVQRHHYRVLLQPVTRGVRASVEIPAAHLAQSPPACAAAPARRSGTADEALPQKPELPRRVPRQFENRFTSPRAEAAASSATASGVDFFADALGRTDPSPGASEPGTAADESRGEQ
ncbi:ATP-binding protein [Saccharothrix sp. AJ9571]|nr:ATP-binding protein [Saccharothrix sp. AJ9571]